MRKIYAFLGGKAFFAFFAASFFGILSLHAACVLSGTHNASDLPLETFCPGETEIIITGTINMNVDYNLSASGITTITLNGGTIHWASNQNTDLILPANAVLVITNGGSVDVPAGCNSNKKIIFGVITLGVCNDSHSGSPFSFAEINNGGGVSVTGLLPIQLVRFQGRKRDQGILLSWTTVAEVNNDYFLVETSADGRRFTELAKIAGAGQSDGLRDYSLFQQEPVEGVNYYRLRQVDFDGVSTVFDVISVTYYSGKQDGIRLFPNPVEDRFSIILENEPETPVFSLYNTLGQRIEIRITDNHPEFQVDIPAQIPRGLYILSIEDHTGNRKLRQLVLK